MEPAEAIFKRLARLWGRLAEGSGRKAPPEGAVRLESVRSRLEALAALLAGAPMELRAAHDGGGGVTGGAIFLPRYALSSEPEAGAELYRVRVAFSCVVRELGLPVDEELAGVHEATAATLLAVPTVRARLAEAYPAAAARERE